MKVLTLLTLVAGVAAASNKIAGNAGVEYCKGDAADSSLDIESIDIEPNPPIPGEKVRISAKGRAIEDITDDSELSIKFKKSVIHKTFKHPICQSSMSCPSKDLDLSFEKMVPKKAPKGTWDVEVKVKTGKKELACLKGKVDVGGDDI